MRLKRYIFALVAMFFGFSFSALAQTEVGDASALKNALETGGEVQLSADIEVAEQIEIPYDKTVTLDLNGYNINGGWNGSSATNHIYVLSNLGTLTITDTSVDKNGSINSRGVYNYGSLTLEAGKIAAIDGNGGYAVNNEPASSFVMNGGWLAADNEDGDAPGEGYDATALDVPSACTATLNGGKITNAGNYTFAIAAAGTLDIPATSTITVEGRHGAINVSGGTTTINAGTFSIPENTDYSDNVTYVSGGQLIINGGTFIGDSDSPSGGSCVYDAAGCATINGGTFGNSSGGDVWGKTGGTKINGGTFENLIETAHVTVGSTIVNGGKTCRKTEEGLVVIVAKIGETEYTSLQDAIDAAENNDEIVIISEVELTETVDVSADDVITIDLNGKTVSMVYTNNATANHKMIHNKGNLTIKDDVGGGKLSYKYSGASLGTTYAANTITTAPGSVLTVKSGTIENLTYDQAVIAYAIDGRTDGASAGVSVSIEGGTITSKRQSVRLYPGSTISTATLNISGGEFIGRILVQSPNNLANKAVLVISDGIFNTNEYNTEVLYLYGGSDESATSEINATVSGGTFNGEIAVAYISDTDFISGGTYTSDPTEWCAEGYRAVKNGDKYCIAISPSADENGYVETLEIVDGQIPAFYNENEVTVGSLTYKRTLASDKFNALYVPFAIPVTQELLEDYEFFSFDAEQSEEDALVVTRVEEGSLDANTPYLVRPLTEEAKKMTIALQNVILPSTATEQSAKKLTSEDGTEFVITGTYTSVSGADYKDFYGVSVNGRFAQIGETGSLGAFRFYMEIKNAESGTESSARSLSIRISGESDDATGIDQIEVAEPAVNIIIDLQGRRVLQPQKGGLYIMNGKKVVF